MEVIWVHGAPKNHYIQVKYYHNSGKIHLLKFSIQNYSTKKIFVFEGDRRKFLWVNFFNNVILSWLVKCKKQPDNGSDRYAAKCKHRLGAEHTYLNTQQSFFGKASIGPEYSASNKTQCINVWLVFLIAIIGILDKEHVLSSLFPPKPFCIFAKIIARGLAKRLIDWLRALVTRDRIVD